MVMPGDNAKMKVELITPIAMEEGLKFAIREGERRSEQELYQKYYRVYADHLIYN